MAVPHRFARNSAVHSERVCRKQNLLIQDSPLYFTCFNSPGRAVDANGTRMDPYEDVVEIFAELKEAGIKIAAASR